MADQAKLEEKILSASMDIILHSGDARNAVAESVEALAGFDFGLAKQKLEIAQKFITMAHNLHTEIIQDEENSGAIKYALLFSHAQDTLMTINTEINMAKQYMRVFAAFEKRIAKLEEDLST